MAKSPNTSALSALLGLEPEDAAAANNGTSAVPQLPTLDERVEMFLRAIHGPGRAFSIEERSVTRRRLLDAMVDDLPGAMVSDVPALAEELTEFQSAPRASASSDSAPIRPVLESVKQNLQRGLELGIGLLRDAVLAPFALIPAAGGMRLAAASLVALVVVSAGWSGAWLYSARSIERIFAAWIGSEAAAGRAYGCGSRSVGGYPFRIEVRCIAPQMKVNIAQAAYVLKAKEIVSTAQVLQPGTLTADIVGPLVVSALDEPVTLVGSWNAAQVNLRGVPTAPERISAVVAGLKINRVAGDNAEMIAQADYLEVDAGQDASTHNSDYDIAAKIGGGSIDAGSSATIRPFSAEIAALLHGISGLTPKPITARLQDWQAGGGRIELRRVRVQQEDAVALAQGNIELAGNGDLIGALQVITTKTGLEHIAQGVVGGGNSDRVQQFALSLGGPRNAQPSDVDNAAPASASVEFEGKETIDVPIRFAGGVVFIGPNAVGRISPLY
jgi:hypothetical protein